MITNRIIGGRDPTVGSAVTIRAKLYAAIVLTILGPLATTAVALHGMAQMGDRFDEVRERGERESLALEIKFAVTDMNGWQTAYGYAGGAFATASSPRRQLRRDLGARRRRSPTRARRGSERGQRGLPRLHGARRGRLARLQQGDDARVKRILLGPELAHFEAMARPPTSWPLEAAQATATERAFDEARDDARKRLIAVALGRGRGDHPAARHRERHRADGARGRAPRARALDD